MITSLHNPRVKKVLKLRDRRGRARQGRTIIDGVREISRAIQAGVSIEEIFLCREQCRGEESQRVLAAASSRRTQLLEVSLRVFERISFGERSEGIVAAAHIPQRQLADLTCGSNPLVAVLEGIQKPGNIGAIIRSADGAGISAVLVVDGGTDLYNPNTIRASLGTIFSVPVCSAAAREVSKWLADGKVRIAAASVDGTLDYDQFDFTGPSAIVLGSEAAGLSACWLDEPAIRVRLPMQGTVDSLNVSAAATVLFYEAQRQRRRA